MRYTAVRRKILASAKNSIRAIVLDTDNRYYMSPGSHASVIVPSVRHYNAVRNRIDIADELELARERASDTSNGVEHVMNTILDDKWRSSHDTKDHLTATTEAIDALTRQDSSWGMRMDRVIVHTGSKLLALSETGDADPVVSLEASRDDLDTMAVHARDAIEHPDMADEGWGLSIVALGSSHRSKRCCCLQRLATMSSAVRMTWIVRPGFSTQRSYILSVGSRKRQGEGTVT